MKRLNFSITTLLIVFLFTNGAISQDNSVIPFKSLDPSNENFEDLQFLKNQIGDKQIVMIGEQDHLAGASIDAKARICNYLIKEMGFEVVLFESGFYDVNKAVQYDKINNSNNFRYSLYFLWAKNQNIAQFLNNLGEAAKQDKLYLEGFDPKFTSIVPSKFYISDLEQVLQKINYSYPDKTEWDAFKKLIQNAADKFDKKSIKLSDADRILLTKVSSAVSKALISAKANYWATLVQNNTQIIVEYSKVSLKDAIALNDKFQKLDSFRDSLMAENAKYLIENRYKGKKVIIWAASYHITQSPDIIKTTGKHYFKGKKIMGDIIAKTYPDKVYSIGFVSYQGKYGISFDKPKGKEIKPHSDNSMEKYLNALGHPLCWVRLKDNSWSKNRSAMINGFNNESYTSDDWSKNFDALIYIENMYPNVLK